MNGMVGQLRSLRPEETVGTTDIKWADGVFGKTIALSRASMVVPQHSHVYPHVSVLVRGKVRVWAGDKELGDFEAPVGITIAVSYTHLTLPTKRIV